MVCRSYSAQCLCRSSGFKRSLGDVILGVGLWQGLVILERAGMGQR